MSEDFGSDDPQCPNCGENPETVVEKPSYAKSMFRSRYCGECGCRIGGEPRV